MRELIRRAKAGRLDIAASIAALRRQRAGVNSAESVALELACIARSRLRQNRIRDYATSTDRPPTWRHLQGVLEPLSVFSGCSMCLHLVPIFLPGQGFERMRGWWAW